MGMTMTQKILAAHAGLPWKYFRHWQPYKKSSKKINSDSLLPPFIIISYYIIKYSYGKYVYYVLGL